MVEFYEALGRIAEAASLQAIKGTTEIEEGEDLQPWTLEKRKAQPLGYKLEALLVRMLSNLCDAAFKEKYILKYKTTTNYFEAVKSFWDEHLA